MYLYLRIFILTLMLLNMTSSYQTADINQIQTNILPDSNDDCPTELSEQFYHLHKKLTPGFYAEKNPGSVRSKYMAYILSLQG
jgi:hypothetical protein